MIRAGAVLLLVGCVFDSRALQTAGPQTDLVRDLLSIAAPPPAAAPTTDQPRTPFPEPADGAPLEILLRYWSQRPEQDPGPNSDSARQRLLEACEAQPEYLARLLNRLPKTPAAQERIKALFDREQQSAQFGDDWRAAVKRYLMYRTRYFLPDLIRAARAAHDEDSSPRGEEDLKALAALDWLTAEPILKNHVASKNQRIGAVCLGLLYAHYLAAGATSTTTSYRGQLKRLVEDRVAAGRSRDIAAEALLTTQWQGRDEWYWSLFRDPTLRELQDGYMMMTPLSHIEMDTDKWIAGLASRVGDTNRAVHDVAVSCLVGFQLQNARRDALLPLLPWLKDPKWSSARDRLRLIQSMDRVEMQEAVPGLIAVLDQDDEYDRSYAAESLAHYRPPEAAPALRRALEREREWQHRARIIKALAACGGISNDDAVLAIEALATQISTERGQQELQASMYTTTSSKHIPAQVMLGMYLSNSKPPDDAVVFRLLERAKALQAQHPAVARALFGMIEKWPARGIDEDLVKRIANDEADAAAVYSALRRRDTLRKTVAGELKTMSSEAGVRAGIATILLADRERASAILNGDDRPAQRGLLASARLIREPLPINAIGALLENSDRWVIEAAEAYLVAEDSAPARKLVLSRHPGEAVILGARQEGDPGHNTYSSFDEIERQLQEDARKGNEIYALLSAGYWGDAGQIIVRIRGDSAVVMYTSDPARYYERTITSEELKQLREFVATSTIEELGPLAIPAHDGMQYEYVHVSPDGGRRVFMNNPGLGGTGGSPYDRVCDYFRRFPSSGKMELKYRVAGKVPGFEVLLADSALSVLSVWKRGPDVRVLTQKAPRRSSGHVFVPGDGAIQVSVGSAEGGKPEWATFSGGKVGAPSQAASEFLPLDLQEHVPPTMEIEENRHASPWSLNAGDSVYLIGTWNGKTGFWRCIRGRDLELLLEGNCAFPVVTPDGKWAVVAKADDSWAEPNHLFLVDLARRKVTRVNVPAADTFNPVAYVPAHRKILLLRARDTELGTDTDRAPVGPSQPEFRLLDPATGHTEVVSGEFEPLVSQSIRPLQPTGRPNEVWAARFNSTCEIGRYDTKAFTFHSVLSLPAMRFSSMQMWIEEAESWIYVAYNGHLLRMALPKE